MARELFRLLRILQAALVDQDTSQEDHRLLLRALRVVIRLVVNSRPTSSRLKVLVLVLLLPASARQVKVHQAKVRQVKVRQVKVLQAAVSLREAALQEHQEQPDLQEHPELQEHQERQEHQDLQELQERLAGDILQVLQVLQVRLVLMAKVHLREPQELVGDILRVLQVLQALQDSRRSKATLEWLWREPQPL